MRSARILGAASAALLASVSAVAIAQDAGDRKGNAPAGGREVQSAPTQPPGRQAPAVQQRTEGGSAARESAQPRNPTANDGKASGSAGRADDRKGQAADTRKANERANQSAQTRDRREGAQKSEQQQTEGADRAGKPAPKKSADEGRSQAKQSPRTTESAQPPSRTPDTAKANEKAGANRAAKRAQEPKDKAGSASSGAGTGEPSSTVPRSDNRTVGTARLNDQQRTVVRERLFAERRPQARSRNVNVHVTIGSALPRGIALAILPSVIVQDVPEYRGYRYAIVDEEIIIVEPRTSRVVEIIERGGESRAAGTGSSRDFQLSAAEQRIVYDAVIADFAPVDVRVKLGLGASIPQHVNLAPFPRHVVDRLPRLKDYSFVVVEREVVIVDPRNREIVLLVDG